MSKALKVVGKVAGIVASVASRIPGGQLIAGIAAGVSIAASIGSELTAKKPPILGSVSDITIGADMARPMMIGDTYCGGALVHQVGYGKTSNDVPNPNLAMPVIYSAGGPIAGIDQYLADFQPLSFVGGLPNTIAAPRFATGYFANILAIDIQLGATPEPNPVVTPWANIPDWGAAHKLSGFAAVMWGLKWDSKNGKYNSGAPQFGIRGRGVLTWDPRKDSSWPGGSGTQRWTDPRANPAGFAATKASWAYSFRPGLHALRYALGTWERPPGSAADAAWLLTYGIGMPIDGIVVDDFIELENVCEANDWEVSGILYEPGDKWANLKRILMAGGAEPCWKGGRLGLKISAPRVSLDTITRADLADQAISAAGAQPRADRINTVIPKFRSPAHKWELQQSDQVVVTDFLAEDKGEERRREEVFEFVKVPKQAAQLAALKLFDSREQGPIQLPCGPRLRRYAGGDKLTLAPDVRDDLGLAHSDVVVLQRALDPVTMTVTLTLVTENALKHILAMAVTGTAPAAITIPTTEELDLNSGVGNVLSQIEALADDAVLTRFEKITKLIPLDAQLQAELDLLALQVPPLSGNAGVAAAAAEATAARTAWLAYRNGLVPGWNDSSADTAIDRATYNARVHALRLAIDTLASALRAATEDLANAALDAADAAGTLAAGKSEIFYQSTPPAASASAEGDLWVNTGQGNLSYRRLPGTGRLAVGGTGILFAGNGLLVVPWAPVADQRIAQALIDAAGAQATADGKVVTFSQEAQPIAEGVGDLWFQPSTKSLKRWSGSIWLEVSTVGATDAQIAQIGQALTAAESAQATADGKIASFYQATPPSVFSEGDYWTDTDDGNKFYRATADSTAAGVWQLARDAGIQTAIIAAAGAQATADGKVTSFVGTGAPVAEGVGDLWYNPSTGVLLRWDGASWLETADATALNQASMTGPTVLTFTASYAGVLDSGQVPREAVYTRLQGTANVSAGSAWALASIDGVAATIDAGGVVTVTAVSKLTGSFTVRSTYQGVVHDLLTTVQRKDSAPPVSTGGGGGNPGTTGFTNVSASTEAATYGGATSPSFSCVAGSAGTVALSAPLNVALYSTAVGNYSQLGYAKWQWRASGGSWADVGAEIAADAPSTFSKSGESSDATLSATSTKTGLTTGSTYEFRLAYRKGSGGAGQIMSFSGTGTGIGQ